MRSGTREGSGFVSDVPGWDQGGRASGEATVRWSSLA